MQDLYRKLFLFLILLKACDLALYSLFKHAAARDISVKSDYGSLKRVYQGLVNTDIIALGSSRIYLHINPAILEEETGKTAWNLGMDGSGFDQHVFMLEEYLLHNRPPQIVLFEADLYTLDTTRFLFERKKEHFLPYIAYSSHTADLFNTSWHERAFSLLFSSAAYRHEVPGFVNDPASLWNQQAADIRYLDTGEIIFVQGAHLKKGQVPGQLPSRLPFDEPKVIYDFSHAKERMRKMEALAEMAERQGFLLVLVMSPHLQGQLDAAQRDFAVEYYSGLEEKYPRTYFLNYSDAEPFSTDTSLWWNVGHLNEVGANAFSRVLACDVAEILSGIECQK